MPPNILLHALAKLRADDFLGETEVSQHLSKILSQPKFAPPGPEYDTLHLPGATGVECYERPRDIVHREPRGTTTPRLFFGNIASSDCVLNDGLTRDGYSQSFGRVLCFETEAVGLIRSFPCVVVRGICDYADSHRNKWWQPYAAATASACAKELLLTISPANVLQEKPIRQ